MEPYITALRAYLMENPPVFTRCQLHSLLGMLFCCYHQQSNGDSQDAKACFGELDNILRDMPIQEQDRVVDVACKLSSLHQQEGFEAGVMVGFQLFCELNKERSSLG